jgi:MFS family permease
MPHTLPYPGKRTLTWAVILFFLASITAVMDRKIISLLVDPMRHDLHITDVQIGILQGAAFAICYSLGGIPLGFAADRYSRSRLMVAGIAMWSIATIFSGMASGFLALSLCRIFVGLGEATLSPSVVSLIGDLAPPARRGRLIAIFLMGQSIANGLSILLVGLVLAAVPSGLFGLMPQVSHLVPWRTAFWVAGGIGVVIAFLLLTLREPARRGDAGARRVTSSVADTVRYFRDNFSTLLPFYLGFSGATTVMYGLTAWGPTLLIRQYGMTAGQVGAILGPLIIATSVIGSLAGGFLADWLSHKGSVARMSVMPLTVGVMLPGALAPFMPNAALAVLMVGISSGTFVLVGTLHLANLQDLVPAQMRGVGAALTNMFGGMVGFSVGPLVIAAGSTLLSADGKRIGESMAIVTIPILALASIAYYMSYRAHRRGAQGAG